MLHREWMKLQYNVIFVWKYGYSHQIDSRKYEELQAQATVNDGKNKC